MRFIAVISVLALAGCATVLTEKAEKIQVHSQMSTLLTDCKNLGPVSAKAEDVWMGRESSYAKAKVMLREKAADAGGDTVVMINTDYVGSDIAIIQGTAMKCYP